MGRRDWIGYRVARWRDISGISQQELADRVEISREHLSRIENGHKAVTDRRMLYALASALGVDVGDLTDQPTQPRTRHDLVVYNAVPALRSALDDDPDAGPVQVDQVRRQVDKAMAARMACDYEALAQLLPGAVAQSRQLANVGGEGAPAGLALFVRAAVCGALAVKPFGYVDLAKRLAERAQVAARMLDLPAEKAAAEFATAQCALASGTAGGRQRSYAGTVAAAETLGDAGSDDLLTWYTMLHLHAALSAASLGRVDDALTHHREAATTAGRFSSDPWRMEPVPANVGVWRVGIALENGEPERAPMFARKVDRTALRTRQRVAHLHIQAGRGAYTAADQAGAVRHFLQADEVAPSELRSRPSVRELVGQMVRDSRRRGSAELRDLATRVGVDPLDPGIDLHGHPELM